MNCFRWRWWNNSVVTQRFVSEFLSFTEYSIFRNIFKMTSIWFLPSKNIWWNFVNLSFLCWTWTYFFTFVWIVLLLFDRNWNKILRTISWIGDELDHFIFVIFLLLYSSKYGSLNEKLHFGCKFYWINIRFRAR